MSITHQQAVITTAAALDLITRAIAEAGSLDVPVSVAVVDPTMSLVAFAKADGATPHSVDSSRRKANTAASIRRPTGGLTEDLALALPLATELKLTNIAGGHPITVEGAVAGAIGIAGGTPAQDARVAEAAVRGISTA